MDICKWVDVSRYEGSYQVSDAGAIRSLDRQASDGRRVRGRTLTPTPNNSNGYAYVTLYGADGSRRNVAVAGLVLSAFSGSRPEGQEVRHLNGDKLDNNVDNLVWGTHTENEADKRRHGTHHETRKTHCPRKHLLAPWNNVASSANQGKRKCLSCDRAASWGRHYGRSMRDQEVQARADSVYALVGVGHDNELEGNPREHK